MSKLRSLVIAGMAFASQLTPGSAQVGPYKLQNINFDMWCQEERHLPPARCDKRLPQDDADYQAYVAKIENYEIPYLQERQDEDTLNRVILHSDPIDHPLEPSAPQVNQPPPG